MTEKYVLGFAFDKNNDVILVRKSKPKWQQGMLNGVGGGIEDFDASSKDAMVREFKEETGLSTVTADWKYVTTMKSDIWQVDVYSMTDNHTSYQSLDGQNTDTDETLAIVNYRDVLHHNECISNLGWLIGLCFDGQTPLEYNITFKGETE